MAGKGKLAAVEDETPVADPIDEAVKESIRPDIILCTPEEWQAVENHRENVQQHEQALVAARQRFHGVLFMLAMEYKIDLAVYRFDHSQRGFVKV